MPFFFLLMSSMGAGVLSIIQQIAKKHEPEEDPVVADDMPPEPFIPPVVEDEEEEEDPPADPPVVVDDTGDETPENPDTDPPADDEPPTGDDTGSHDGHDTGDGSGGDGMGGHDHGSHDHADCETNAPVLDTPEAIEAFIAELRSAPEAHIHSSTSGLMDEHTAVLDLVPRAEATHIAIGSGSWFDPDNWYGGEIPGDDAKVLIPEGICMDYDGMSDARLFTLRVDGGLEFATDVDTKMVIDTFIVSPSGHLTIGTVENPIAPDVNAEIVIANNGPIDTDWDPMLFSRGLISHGKIEIHGDITDAHEKVIADPMAGDTFVEFSDLPEGWSVGDTIVIAGTHYEGHKWDNTLRQVAPYEPEDEVRVISAIEGGRVYFDEPLVHDHDTPREDLKTSVANYTRNVTIGTEDPENAEVFERGHTMFMHSDDIDVRYASFWELGRTDKSEPSDGVTEFDNVEFDTNIQSRYPLHLHRTGTEPGDDPALLIGNAVYASPGWGIVHHDSNAIIDGNATYDTYGAGYVAETGNEIGSWSDNIAIYAEGISWAIPKNGVDLSTFDTGRTGDGFWFQGRLVDSTDNIAASVNTGFVYFHRDGDDGMIKSSAEDFIYPDAFYYETVIRAADFPILNFSGNEAFAAKEGLHIVKNSPMQGHDVHSVLEDFTAWSVTSGAHLQYTAHYTLKNFDIIAREDGNYVKFKAGISFGNNVNDITIVDSTIQGFDEGIDLHKGWTNDSNLPEWHKYTVVNATFIDVGTEYVNYDPTLDTILNDANRTFDDHDIELDGPLVFDGSTIDIDGTKTDSLGTTEYEADPDKYDISRQDAARILENAGYYETQDGQEFFFLDFYFSDRLTGEVYAETHAIQIAENVTLEKEGSLYEDAVFKGTISLDGAVVSALEGDELVEALALHVEPAIPPEEEDDMMDGHMAA